MPTPLEDLVQSAGLPIVLDHMGKDVTYTPSGDNSRTIKCVIAVREELDTRQYPDGEFVVQVAMLIALNDATTGVTSIDDDDKFLFSGSTWTPDKWHRLDGAHEIEVVRIVRATLEHEETIDHGA